MRKYETNQFIPRIHPWEDVNVDEVTYENSILIEEDDFDHYIEDDKVVKLGNKYDQVESENKLVFTLVSSYLFFETTPGWDKKLFNKE